MQIRPGDAYQGEVHLPLITALVAGASFVVGIVSVRARTRLVGMVVTVGCALTLGFVEDGTLLRRHEAKTKPPACGATIDRALAANRWTEALAATKGCDDPARIADVRFTLGDFPAASAAFKEARRRDPERVPSVAEAEAHLFANDDAAAADVVRRMVEQFYRGPETPERRQLACIARKLVEPEDRRWPCVPVQSYALPGFGGSSFAPYDRATRSPFRAYFGTRGRLRGRPIGVERIYLERGAVDSGYRPLPSLAADEPAAAAWAAEVALFDAWSGDTAAAEALFPRLDAAADELQKGTFDGQRDAPSWFADRHDEIFVKEALAFAAAAAMYAGDDARVDRYIAAGAESHSAGALLQARRMLDPAVPWEEPGVDGHWHDHEAVFAAAKDGDAVAVVAALEELHSTGAETLPRVYPRLTMNQHALRTWFTERFPPPCRGCSASDLFGHLVDRRRVAALLGFRDEEAALAPVVARVRDALLAEAHAHAVGELEAFYVKDND